MIQSQTGFDFNVYPVYECIDNDNNKSITYISKENEPDLAEKFIEDQCLKKMSGSFCWRGVWEGRLYFTDEEYWGEEISMLSEAYNDHIIPWCKKAIITQYPEHQYDE